MNLVLKVFSPFTAYLQIPNSDRVSGAALTQSLFTDNADNLGDNGTMSTKE